MSATNTDLSETEYHHSRVVEAMKAENDDLKAKLSETVIHLATRNSEIAELKSKLGMAMDIIKDMEKNDDAQAFKEARKFIKANAPEQP